jgi:predicted nucleotidyltransferase
VSVAERRAVNGRGDAVPGNETDAAAVREKIDEMARIIVERFDPDKIILFGSHARGDAGPDSDVDLLVVMAVTRRRLDLMVEVRLAVRGMGLAKDIAIVTPEEFEAYRDTVGTIVWPAVREGKVLYERAA